MKAPLTLPRIPSLVPKPSKVRAAPLRLKHWTFAGLLMTYWCNAKCAFCYVYSGPNKKGPTLGVSQALALWSGLNRLLEEDGLQQDGGGAPLPCKVHFAGGEPFFDFDRLLEIARAAQTAGLRLFEKVETNAFWAQDDAETRRRITLLKDAGMEMLMISADVYHQEFVPVERCRRAARIAREVLGDKGVRVRWWDSLDVQVDVQALPESERQKAFADALVRHRERILGRAADQLADFYECHPPEHFRAERCPDETLGSKHVHIDAYGNVFPGVCSGIVWGRITPPDSHAAQSPPDSAAPQSNPKSSTTPSVPSRTLVSLPIATPHKHLDSVETQPISSWPQSFATIEDLWRYAAAHWPDHPIISRVVDGGSYRLYELARDLGFVPRPGGYANKCHLCHDVRRWLFARGTCGSTLGPAEVYVENPNSTC